MTQFGDENTKFFHSMATERFRKNVISQIMDDTGRMVSSHEEKSALFWNEFRRRLGLSVHTNMQFDLQTIVKRHDNLEDLCRPFSTEEIDNVILDLPSDKALGPVALTILLSKNVGPLLDVTCISCALISFIIGLTSKASITLTLHWSPRKIILRK
jgi:hypothetical protein